MILAQTVLATFWRCHSGIVECSAAEILEQLTLPSNKQTGVRSREQRQAVGDKQISTRVVATRRLVVRSRKQRQAVFVAAQFPRMGGNIRTFRTVILYLRIIYANLS